MMKMWLTCCSRGTLIILLAASAAWAQATAQMSGAVRDESGAVLPGVTVTVTQVETSVTRTAVTDETGAYLLPNLPTGPYKLQVSLQGFRTFERTGIVLQVGATPTITVVLAVSGLAEPLAGARHSRAFTRTRSNVVYRGHNLTHEITQGIASICECKG
jgi:hypothetical protein